MNQNKQAFFRQRYFVPGSGFKKGKRKSAYKEADLKTWLDEPQAELIPKEETLILKMSFSTHADSQQVLLLLNMQRAAHKKNRLFTAMELRFGEMYEEGTPAGLKK